MNKSESKYFHTAEKMDLALISLLQKKPLVYITVSEICKAAGVNRSTFYLHYETIGDLLDETARYLLNDFLACFFRDISSVSLDFANCKLEELLFICDRYLDPYLNYIKDHKEVFGTVLLHTKTFGFEDVYRRMFESIFDPILECFQYPANSRQYVMMYYLNGINAIVMEWLSHDCDKTVQEISEMISVCIYGQREREWLNLSNG